MDTAFNQIRLDNGLYRGFIANAHSYAVDGVEPWSLGASRQEVLAPGPVGSYDECGRWINGTDKVGQNVYGFIHAERSCNYSQGQTHKSMVFAVSPDEGLHWSVLGQMITGTDAPTPGRITGEGDCSVVQGGDGYSYAYCLRNRDWSIIVARAPAANPWPGSWVKYFNGSWSQPGLGGDATALGPLGTAAGRWVDNDHLLLLDTDPGIGGLKISFSKDKTSFTTLGEPLIPVDGAVRWDRPAPTEFIAYLSVLNYNDSRNQITSPFLLTHVYIQPGEGFDQRYLVFRDVWMWLSPSPVTPQVGITLSRWYDAAGKDRWATTAPVPSNYTRYAYEANLGNLMTKAPSWPPTVKLEDCVSDWPGHPDHILSTDGQCVGGGYTRLRTAGWAYRDPQQNTLPLYRCYNSLEQHHFASNQSDCEGLGYQEELLGYTFQ
jgi:hypothetical protein